MTGADSYVNVIYIHTRGSYAHHREESTNLGKPAWIALTILGFVIWWPVGLALLAFVIGSGRMGCWKGRGMSRWHRTAWSAWSWQPPRSSGNRAFDEYRSETLKRLEEEQREFREFLDRLRFAKDKTEFDQFMAERRNRHRSGALRYRTDLLVSLLIVEAVRRGGCGGAAFSLLFSGTVASFRYPR